MLLNELIKITILNYNQYFISVDNSESSKNVEASKHTDNMEADIMPMAIVYVVSSFSDSDYGSMATDITIY